MELIKIVDENGNFTGKIMDKDEAHDKNLLHNEVGLFLINDKGQVLLQKRSSNKRFDPNKWALCAGHVEAHESLEEAMLREAKEEIGIDISKNDLHQFGEKDVLIRNSNSHITYFYYIKTNMEEKEFTIQEDELSEVKWFYIDEVIDMINKKDTSIVFGGNRLKLFEQLKNI